MLLALNVGDTREQAAEFLAAEGLTLPVGLDPQKRVAGRYSVTSLPVLFLIGREGQVEARHDGHTPALQAEILSEIEILLRGGTLHPEL